MKWKDKDDLDKMNKEKIEKYRIKFLTNSTIEDWYGSEDKRYIEELGLYLHLRFKEDVHALYKQ